MNTKKMILLISNIILLLHMPLTRTMELNNEQSKKKEASINKLLLAECVKSKPILTNISFFIAQGANINVQNYLGATPLHYSVARNNFPLTELLLKHNPQVEIKVEGITPLFIACEEGYFAIAQLLIEHGADVNSRNSTGTTPLHQACEFNHFDIVKLLIKNKADVNASNDLLITPLHIASDLGFLDTVAFLLKNDANVNAKTKIFNTSALIFACQHNSIEIIKVLLQYGADINATTIDGHSPLLVAIENNQIKVCELLLQSNANAYITTNQGLMPLDFAYDKNNKKIIALFKQYGISTISEQQAEQNMHHFFKELNQEASQKKAKLAQKKQKQVNPKKEILISKKQSKEKQEIKEPLTEEPTSTTAATTTSPITTPISINNDSIDKENIITSLSTESKTTIKTEKKAPVSEKSAMPAVQHNGYQVIEGKQLKWPRSLHQKQEKLIEEHFQQLKNWPNHSLNDIKLLKGSPNTYRLRVGSHRIVFSVNNQNRTITINAIRLRKNVYKKNL